MDRASPDSEVAASPVFLAGGGEMGALIRAFDWSSHPLGPPGSWPQPLKTAVRLLLNVGHPAYVFWGEAGFCFYNDAYRPSIGPERHPRSLGRPARLVWDEIWDIIGPQIDQVMTGRGATWHVDQLVPITRHGRREDVYWTYSYSPIDDAAAANGVGGVLVICAETTRQVRARDRLTAERERQRLMLKLMPGFAALLSGPDHRYDYVNDAYVAIAGDRPYAGRTVREVFPDLADQGFFALLDRVYANGEPFAARAMPVAFDRPNGNRFIDFLYQPVRDEADRPAGIFVGGYDVTDQVRAQRRRDALIALDERFRGIAEPAELSYAASKLVGETLGVVRVGYGTLDAEARTVSVERAWTADGYADVAGLHHFRDYGSYIAELLCGDTVANNDVTGDSRTADQAAAFTALGIRAHLDVPILEGGRAVAQMFVHSATPRHWSDEDIVFVRDVADRTRAAIARRIAEHELRASEAELRFTLSAGRFGAWTLDLVSGELTTSATCRANFGRADDDAFTYAELRDAVRPDHRQAMAEAVERSIATRSDYDIEYPIITPAGETRFVQIRGQPAYAADGTPVQMRGVSIDITGRRATEQALRDSEVRYRSLFDTIDEGFCVIELIDGPRGPMSDYLHVEANTAFASNAGMPDVIGKRCRELVSDAEADGWVATYREVLVTGTPVRFERVLVETGRDLEVAAFRVEPPGRRQVAVLFRDVSDRTRAEAALRDLAETMEARVVERTAQLEAAHEQLRQSQKLEAMGSLTGGVAHDFNNLLTPIVGALDLLQRRGHGGEREQRLIDGAVQSAERAKTLVQRLLAFARRQPLQPIAVDLGQLVHNMAELVSSTTGPQIKVVTDVAPDLPPAKADPNQLEMAVLNLSVNARDAMPDGGTLRISVTRESIDRPRGDLKRGHYVRLSVADTGTGMDEATIARAVEPFFSTKGIGKGTGLGLSMAHGLAAQLGGALTIQSRRGVGTNVELWLPISTTAIETACTAPETVASGQARGLALLVDDEDVVRATTADMLLELGYHVHEAASGEAALAAVGDGLRPDLLVTDHLMPGMSGVDVVRAVRATLPDLPALIVSGYAEADGIAADLPRLTKPFRSAELAASVADLTPGGR